MLFHKVIIMVAYQKRQSFLFSILLNLSELYCVYPFIFNLNQLVRSFTSNHFWLFHLLYLSFAHPPPPPFLPSSFLVPFFFWSRQDRIQHRMDVSNLLLHDYGDCSAKWMVRRTHTLISFIYFFTHQNKIDEFFPLILYNFLGAQF